MSWNNKKINLAKLKKEKNAGEKERKREGVYVFLKKNCVKDENYIERRRIIIIKRRERV